MDEAIHSLLSSLRPENRKVSLKSKWSLLDGITKDQLAKGAKGVAAKTGKGA